MSPSMVQAILQETLQTFVGFRSLLLMTRRCDLVLTPQKFITYFVHLRTAPGSNVYDLPLFDVKGHVPFFRPLHDKI